MSVKAVEEIERPTSPWTPSYSVLTQGSTESAAETPEDVEEAAPASAAPEIVLDHADAEPETPEAEATAIEEAVTSEAVEEALPALAMPDIIFNHVDAAESVTSELEAEEAPDSAADSIHAPESIHAHEPTAQVAISPS